MTVAVTPERDAVSVTVRTAMLKALLCKEIIAAVPRKRSNYTVPVFYPRNLYAVEGCYYSSYRKENFVLPNSRHVQFDDAYTYTFSPGQEKLQKKPMINLTRGPVFDCKELLHKELLKKVPRCSLHLETTRLIDWLHRCKDTKVFYRSDKAFNSFPTSDFVHDSGIHPSNYDYVTMPNAFAYRAVHKQRPMVHYSIGKYAIQHWAVQAYRDEHSQKHKRFEDIHKELLQKVLPCPSHEPSTQLFGFIYRAKDGTWERCGKAKWNIAPNKLICAYKSVARRPGTVIMPTCDHWVDVTPFALNSILCYSIGCQPKEHWCVQAFKDEAAARKMQKLQVQETWRKVERELLSTVSPCPSHQPLTLLTSFLYVEKCGFWTRGTYGPPLHARACNVIACMKTLYRSCGNVFFPNSDWCVSFKPRVYPTLYCYSVGQPKECWYLQAYRDERNAQNLSSTARANDNASTLQDQRT